MHIKTNKQLFNSFLEKLFQQDWHDVNHKYYLQNTCCYTDYCVIHKTDNQSISEYQSPYIRPERQYAPYFSRFTYDRLLNLFSSFNNGNTGAETALLPQHHLAIS